MDLFQMVSTYYPDWSPCERIILAVILFLVVGTLLCLYREHRICRKQMVAVLLLAVWLLLVIGSTVFTRMPGERQYQLELFWSWKEIFDHRGRLGAAEGNGLLIENILNIFLLMPVGMLLPVIFNKPIEWWHAFLSGVVISAAIECLQLILCRGLFEFDDIIHNSIGCMIGCVVINKLQMNSKNKRYKNHEQR